MFFLFNSAGVIPLIAAVFAKCAIPLSEASFFIESLYLINFSVPSSAFFAPLSA